MPSPLPLHQPAPSPAAPSPATAQGEQTPAPLQHQQQLLLPQPPARRTAGCHHWDERASRGPGCGQGPGRRRGGAGRGQGRGRGARQSSAVHGRQQVRQDSDSGLERQMPPVHSAREGAKTAWRRQLGRVHCLPGAGPDPVTVWVSQPRRRLERQALGQQQPCRGSDQMHRPSGRVGAGSSTRRPGG